MELHACTLIKQLGQLTTSTKGAPEGGNIGVILYREGDRPTLSVNPNIAHKVQTPTRQKKKERMPHLTTRDGKIRRVVFCRLSKSH